MKNTGNLETNVPTSLDMLFKNILQKTVRQKPKKKNLNISGK